MLDKGIPPGREITRQELDPTIDAIVVFACADLR
jgi:hypothetical protein